jgi:hypothetical protein
VEPDAGDHGEPVLKGAQRLRDLIGLRQRFAGRQIRLGQQHHTPQFGHDLDAVDRRVAGHRHVAGVKRGPVGRAAAGHAQPELHDRLRPRQGGFGQLFPSGGIRPGV